MDTKMSAAETMYRQLTPENRHRIDRRIDALLLQQDAQKMAQDAAALFKSFNGVCWEEQQAYLYRLTEKATRQALEDLVFELLKMLPKDERARIMRPYIEKVEKRRAQA